jgi:predicted ATPase
MAAVDRLTRLSVSGMRSLENVDLPLEHMQVLIGESGSGKSSLIEAFELVRRLAGPGFLGEIHSVHGGAPQLLRIGTSQLLIDIRVDGAEGPLSYCIGLERQGDALGVSRETLELGPKPGHSTPLHVIRRVGGSAQVFDEARRSLVPVQIQASAHLLGQFGVLPPQRAIGRLTAVLSNIQVHVPFDTTPSWIARDSRRRDTAMRSSVVVEPADRISRLGDNLANAWLQLRNDFDEAHWRDTMELVRLGLGSEIESVNVRADPGGGNIGLRLKIRGLSEQVPAFSLSEGTLAFLAFIALYRLGAKSSLIAFDEPETHLHPGLLSRVLQMFEELAIGRPVILATHSDRLLDGLADPVSTAVLCELDESRATRLLRPDGEALRQWLDRYRGVGSIRAEGFERQVFKLDQPH